MCNIEFMHLQVKLFNFGLYFHAYLVSLLLYFETDLALSQVVTKLTMPLSVISGFRLSPPPKCWN